jgi:tripartite-type tricarboxylate transporter receptor subunit TctC
VSQFHKYAAEIPSEWRAVTQAEASVQQAQASAQSIGFWPRTRSDIIGSEPEGSTMSLTFGGCASTVLGCAVLASAGVARAQTQSAATFYASHELTLLVGSTAGSGYDAYARLIAQYMEKYLPGAHIVIRDMPGADGMVATNYLANIAAKDGATFAIVQREAIMDPLLAPQTATQARFDPLKLVWLGSPNREMGMVYVSTRSGALSIEDATTRQYLIAASGSNSGPAVFGRVLNTFVKTKFKIVHGYAGSADAMLAVESGEADGRITSGWAGPERSKATQWVEAGKARLLMQIGVQRSPDYPDLPNTMDYAQNDDDKRVLQYLLTGQAIGNPFIAAPGIPADRAAQLKKAFMSALTDPALVADAKGQLLVIGPVGGDELQHVVERAYATPPQLRKRAQDIYSSSLAKE